MNTATRPRLTSTVLRSIVPEDKPFEIRSKACPGLLARVEPSGTITYWVQVARGKRLRLGNARILTLADAEGRARRVLANPDEYTQAKAAGANLEQFITDTYAPWRKAKYPKTAEGTLARLRTHFERPFYGLPLQELTAQAVEKWATGRLAAGRAPATVERDLAELSAVLSMAVRVGALSSHPMHGMHHAPKVDNKLVRFLTPEEEARLLAALAQPGRPAYLAPMVIASMNLGLRRGELTGLLRADVDLEGRTVTVRGALAKSKKGRVIPMNAKAHDALAAWLTANPRKPGEHVFGVASVKKAFATLLRDAGIEDFWWHALRHHFASRLVQKGVALNTVRELMGHASMAMTLRYAHLAPTHLTAAVELL